jgi:cell division septation protein DedD
MSDHHDRGAYTPQSDAPLAFDARSSRRGGGQPVPMTLIISGVILVVLVAAMAVFFIHNARDNPSAPSAGQSIDAIKAPPAVPDAKPATNGVQIGYTEGSPLPPDPNAPAAPAGATPTFTPPPEAPGARPAPGTSPPAAAASKPPTIDAVLAKARPKTEDEIIAQAQAQKAPTAAKPATAAVQVAKAEPKPALTAAAPKPAAKAMSGPMVQIGAFSTEALAEQSMNAVAAKIPGRTAGKTLKVEKAEIGGKTLNRALVGGFASKADADSFCSALKAQGGDCSVRE